MLCCSSILNTDRLVRRRPSYQPVLCKWRLPRSHDLTAPTLVYASASARNIVP